MLATQMVLTGMWLQGSDSISGGNSKLLMFFVGMVAVALTVQAIALIAMAVGAAKTRTKLVELAQEVHAKAMPMIDTTHEMIRDSAPKVKVITDNFAETSHVVRSKAYEFDATLSDVNERLRSQVARVDGMTSSTLTATSNLVSSVQRTIQVPVREIAGLMNGLRAGLDVLVGKARGVGRNGRGDGAL